MHSLTSEDQILDKSSFLRAVKEALTSRSDISKEITAAFAGEIVHRNIGAFQDSGYSSFKGVLNDLESEGFLRLRLTDKDALAFTLETPKQVDLLGENSTPHQATRSVIHLVPNIWKAFVHTFPTGYRYFNVQSSEVKMGLSEELGDEWVKIDMISATDEHAWTREFLSSENRDIPLDPTDWPKKFIQSIASDRELLRRWNIERSNRVVKHVREWAEEHEIPFNDLLGARKKRDHTVRNPATPQPWDQRQIVMAALKSMTTDELLELNIKAKYLLEAAHRQVPNH